MMTKSFLPVYDKDNLVLNSFSLSSPAFQNAPDAGEPGTGALRVIPGERWIIRIILN